MKPHVHLPRRVLATAVGTGLTFLIAGVLGRASSAALTTGLPPAMAVLIGAVTLAASLIAWWADVSVRPPAEQGTRYIFGLAAVIGPMLLGLTLAGGSASAVALILLQSFIATAGVVYVTLSSAQPSSASRPAENSETNDAPVQRVSDESSIPESAPVETHFCEDDAANDELDAAVSQQLTRRHEQGFDELECLFRVPFAVGQREASVHIPFWPAFGEAPEVECEPLDDSDLEVTAAAVHTYGVRIAARLPNACGEPVTALIGVRVVGASAANSDVVSDAA